MLSPVLRQAVVRATTAGSSAQGPVSTSLRLLPMIYSRPFSSSSPSASASTPPSAPYYSPYTHKKVWPPDFSKLSPQEQLRFEKRYKRRVALRSARPRWIKFIKLAQLFSVTFVVIYAVLFMQWDHGPNPFEPIRKYFWDFVGSLRGGPNQAVTLPSKTDGPAHVEPRK